MSAPYDLVIVGSGGGAFAAALLVLARGGRPLIIEKRDKVGGTSGYSGGVIWIPDNPVQRRAGVRDSRQDARDYLAALIGPPSAHSTLAKREAYLETGPEMVAFLEGQGMKFLHAEGWSDYHDELPGGSARGRGLYAPLFNLHALGDWAARLSVYEHWTMPMNSAEFADLMLAGRTWAGRRMGLRLLGRLIRQKITGEKLRGSGASLQGRLLQLLLRRGGEIWTETPVTGFLGSAVGVHGVVAERGGRAIEVESRAVLINAGGFARDPELRARLQPKPTPRWTNANPGDTGEVLRAAMALGAATANLDLSWYTPTSALADGELPPGVPAPFMHHLDLAKPHVIMVDRQGRRFADESGSYHDIGQAMYAADAVPAFAILESRHRRRYPWGTQPPGPPPRAWLDSGYMLQADSLGELARRCGVDPAGLEATARRFNGFARTGVDLDFGRGGRAFDRHHGDPTCRPNPCLGALERPPFYAVRMFPGDIGTDGGVVTDADARVLTASGEPIPGLYATGNSTASVMDRAYPGPGGTIGPSMVFGYAAARHAMGAQASAPGPAAPDRPGRRTQSRRRHLEPHADD